MAASVPRVRLASRRVRATIEQRRYARLGVAETFDRIYRNRSWLLADAAQPLSGSGSAGRPADRYVESIDELIRSEDFSDVADLGCGDLAVSSRFDLGRCRYLGIDVVPSLIDHHRRQNTDPRRRYECLDVTVDTMPRADAYLIRQVLQHLTNRQIASILSKLPIGSFVVVTESAPLRPIRRPNVDIPHGPHTRLPHGSAVQLDRAPFGVVGGKEVLRVATDHEQIVTTVYSDWPGLPEPSYTSERARPRRLTRRIAVRNSPSTFIKICSTGLPGRPRK